MTNLEAEIKQEIDLQKRMLAKIELWNYMQALSDIEAALDLIEEEDA